MTGLYIVLGSLTALILGYGFLVAPSQRKNPRVESLRFSCFAHRGLYDPEKGIPENSLRAFERAIEHGYGIELDVHVTADLAVVVMHDDTAERMTGVKGKVNEMTAVEFRDLRLKGTNEKVPFLEEVLTLVKGQVPLLVELKADGNNAPVLCREVFKRLDRYEGPYIVESFDPRVLYWVKKHRPGVGRGQLASNAGPTPLIRFVLRNLMANVVGRPHFIAYDHCYFGKYPGPVLCRRLFRCVYYEWTIRDERTFRENEKKGIGNIFEGFAPR